MKRNQADIYVIIDTEQDIPLRGHRENIWEQDFADMFKCICA